jgi:hypothetical protein
MEKLDSYSLTLRSRKKRKKKDSIKFREGAISVLKLCPVMKAQSCFSVVSYRVIIFYFIFLCRIVSC